MSNPFAHACGSGLNQVLSLRYDCDQMVLARLDTLGGWYWANPHEPAPLCADRATLSLPLASEAK